MGITSTLSNHLADSNGNAPQASPFHTRPSESWLKVSSRHKTCRKLLRLITLCYSILSTANCQELRSRTTIWGGVQGKGPYSRRMPECNKWASNSAKREFKRGFINQYRFSARQLHKPAETTVRRSVAKQETKNKTSPSVV